MEADIAALKSQGAAGASSGGQPEATGGTSAAGNPSADDASIPANSDTATTPAPPRLRRRPRRPMMRSPRRPKNRQPTVNRLSCPRCSRPIQHRPQTQSPPRPTQTLRYRKRPNSPPARNSADCLRCLALRHKKRTPSFPSAPHLATGTAVSVCRSDRGDRHTDQSALVTRCQPYFVTSRPSCRRAIPLVKSNPSIRVSLAEWN